MIEEVEMKQQLIEVMKEESALLDNILSQQDVVHACVTKRKWNELESTMDKLQIMSDSFVQLETKRSELSEKIDLFHDSDVVPFVRSVRSKLNKSKIQNNVLNEYIKTTKSFLQGIFDEALPQRRNVLYSKYGTITKPELQSVVLNQVI